MSLRILCRASTCLLALVLAATSTAQTLEQAVEPNVERREVKVADIDAGDFELGVFGGVLSVVDFGANGVYGAKLAYHVTEDFFLEGNYGLSKIDKTTFETINPEEVTDLMTDEDRDYSYYNLSVGYNLFPGESFLGHWTLRSAFYLVAGVGSTSFAGDDLHTIVGGFGYRVTVWRFINVHVDFRDHVFDSDVTFEEKTRHNLEMTTGITASF